MSAGPFQHCPKCAGEQGQWQGNGFRCPTCGFRFYQNVAAAVGVLLQREGRVLFLVRGHEPARGLWGLPGGFVDTHETVEDALRREVAEEIGGTVRDLRYLASFPNQYLFSGVEYHTCDLYFAATLDDGPLRHDGDEVTALVWVRPDEVTPEHLAFPSLRRLWAALPSLPWTLGSQ